MPTAVVIAPSTHLESSYSRIIIADELLNAPEAYNRYFNRNIMRQLFPPASVV
jgi:hypothetical protein